MQSPQKQVHDETTLQLCNNLLRLLSERLSTYETMSIMTLATLLDPRFKTIGFSSQSNAQTAVRRLTSECAAIIRAAQNTPSSQISSSPPSPHSGTVCVCICVLLHLAWIMHVAIAEKYNEFH